MLPGAITDKPNYDQKLVRGRVFNISVKKQRSETGTWKSTSQSI